MLTNGAARALVGAREGLSVAALDPRLGMHGRLTTFSDHYVEFEVNFRERVLNHLLARRTPDGPTVWVIRDLTEQHRLMAELMHRSKMADLGMLGAGIAHEIGNPLSSISAILQLIEMRQSAPDIAERISAARSHVDRMTRILHDMRDFARPSSGTRRAVQVGELLEKTLQIVHMHEKTRAMNVRVAPTEAPLRVHVVEDQIVQVLLNILGISGELQERLFLPFFTTKPPRQGVGLGLFISESIVRAHGGRIQVQSAVGEGSTFTVFLPHCSVEN
ncbi:MAG: hypothetical protein HY269_03130 [Deltaproteobacteria bacterium]|nr:hypothetical protein [Deltaproteobacteria bacterium]